MKNTLLKVDEAEIFEGGENKLTMTQAYTWEFQCEYKLQKYPFDTQVTLIQILKDRFSVFRTKIISDYQECAIKMTVESQTKETVQLLANEVKGFLQHLT